jgi:hypothetical protein
MKRTARRLVALIGAALLLVLALAAGPASAAMIIQGGRGTGFTPVSSPPTGGASVLAVILSAAAIVLVSGIALVFDRRSRRYPAAAEAPAEDAGRVCDDVVCEFRPSRAEVEERKAA